MSVTIYSSGTLTGSGTIIDNAKLDYQQNMYISNGGKANYTTVDRYGSVTISGGGTANSTTVNYYGEMYVSSGGTATHTTMNNFGLMHVSGGGTANSTTFGNGGVIDIFSGGIASNTTVCNNGLMYIEAGGTAKQTTLTTAGMIYVSGGGTAIDTTANAGIIYLSGGGKHTGSLHIASGAMVSAFSGATIDFSLAGRLWADDYLINDLSLVKGTPTYTITVSATQAAGTYKLAQGASNFTGSITIGNGSVTYGSITVNGEALEHDDIKYTLTQTGGDLLLDIQPQSTSPGVFIFSNGMLTSSGTKITGTTLDSGCFALISNGGVMNNTTICSGGYTVIRDGGTADNATVLSGGYVLISNGGVMNNAAISSGGRITVYNGGVANSTTLFGGTGYYDVLFISSGGTAKYTTVYSGGSIHISNGGAASATVVNSGGSIYIYGGGRAENITLKAGGYIGGFSFAGDKYFNSVENGSATVADNVVISGYGMHIQRGGIVNNINVNSGCRVNISGGGIANSASVNSGGRMYISSGGMANSTTVNSFGSVHISNSATANGTIINHNGFMFISGGSANRTVLSGVAFMHINGGVANNTVTSGGWIYVSSGTANHTAISCGGIYVNSGGVAENTVVSNGTVTIFLGGIHRGSLQIDSGSVISAYIGAVVDFTAADRTAAADYLINDLSLIKGAPTYTITVSATQANGTYKLAQGAENFTGSISIGDGTVDYGTITVNGDDLVFDGVAYSLDNVDGNLTLTVTKQPVASNLQGDVNGVSWNGSCDAYSVIYSKDNFATALQLDTATRAVDSYGMPGGIYQWKVIADGDEYKGNDIVSDTTTAAEKLISDGDGNMDLFFARSSGTWSAEYFAQRSGTQKLVALNNKNRIQDVFVGSTDAGVLVLTDDANGDALFIDDIYSALGTQARLSQIDEIRAGAGNDIVDLTSNKYIFAGDGVMIYGGAGDDTIWANAEDDCIIGGTGNDSLFGGGGNDTFIFGKNWGNDTVEQLASGKVTLHFENGSMSNWNAATQVYSDGVNSVTVTGTAGITLKFGEGASLPAGVFSTSANEKIFEDKKAMLA